MGNQCYSDHIISGGQRSVLHQWPGGKGSSPGTQEGNQGIELLNLPICLIRPWAEAEWQSTSRQVQEQGGFYGTDSPVPHWAPFCVWSKRMRGSWRNDSELCRCWCRKELTSHSILCNSLTGKIVRTWHPTGSTQNRSRCSSDLMILERQALLTTQWFKIAIFFIILGIA